MRINKQKSNMPGVAALSRRSFLQLTGMSLVGAAVALPEARGAEVVAEGRRRGPVQMKMPALPCCHPAYRGRKIKDGGYVVWGDLSGKGAQAFRLNGCGGAILGLCNGSNSIEAIAEASVVKHGIGKEDAIAFVEQLQSLGIVVKGGAVTFNPSYPGMEQDATYRPVYE